MGLRDELAVLAAESAAHDKQQEEIHQHGHQISLKLRELKARLAHEEGMLSRATWKYEGREHGGCSFGLLLDGDWKKLPEFRKLYGPDWHESYYLEFVTSEDNQTLGVAEICFDDGDVRLHFDTDEIGIAFIKKWQLKVSFEELEENIERLKQSLGTLTALHQMLKEKLA